jgi:hypothetical protein
MDSPKVVYDSVDRISAPESNRHGATDAKKRSGFRGGSGRPLRFPFGVYRSAAGGEALISPDQQPVRAEMLSSEWHLSSNEKLRRTQRSQRKNAKAATGIVAASVCET